MDAAATRGEAIQTTAIVPARAIGKRSDSAYEEVGVYIQKKTRRRAIRKYEDEGGSEHPTSSKLCFRNTSSVDTGRLVN